jgi:hypothetical protein
MNKQLSLKQIIITVVIFLIVYIFIVSNYRFKMTDNSQYTTEMVTMGKMTAFRVRLGVLSSYLMVHFKVEFTVFQYSRFGP